MWAAMASLKRTVGMRVSGEGVAMTQAQLILIYLTNH